MPPQKVCVLFEQAVKEFNPDIIHVWGSENPFKLLPFQAIKNIPVLLTIQGVLGSIGETILKGLSFREVASTVGLREILTNSSLLAIRRSFIKETLIEQQMLRAADFIETQSDWTDSQIMPINSSARFFRTQRVLRDSFLHCSKWLSFEHSKPVIYTASWGYSLKGLHILINALAIVRDVFPDVELRIAGAVGRHDWLGDGYLRLILRMIRKHRLEQNVVWLGAIDSNEIGINLQQASVFVSTSFVESYSLTLAEAMCIGTPSVISYAGAMPELALPEREALFFSPGDYKRCANQIIKLLKNVNLALELSSMSVKRSKERERDVDVVEMQTKTYKEILKIRGNRPEPSSE
jgi:glycosyltransferase involved in cell wall biosynthesis